jgi:hypothetical protein
MPATQPHTFAASASQDLIDAEFPMWHTGTCVLRDPAGRVCGSCWFARADDGGIVLVVGPVNPGIAPEVSADVGEDDTWW